MTPGVLAGRTKKKKLNERPDGGAWRKSCCTDLFPRRMSVTNAAEGLVPVSVGAFLGRRGEGGGIDIVVVLELSWGASRTLRFPILFHEVMISVNKRIKM